MDRYCSSLISPTSESLYRRCRPQEQERAKHGAGMNYAQKKSGSAGVLAARPRVGGSLCSATELAALHDDGPHELLVLLCVGRASSGPREDILGEALVDAVQCGECLGECSQ